MASIENARKNNLNDRSRKAGRPEDEQLSTQDIDTLIAFYDYTCLKCGTKPANSPDHVIPLSKGGTNTLDNLQLLDVNCNKQKGDDETDYRAGKICPNDLHQEQERKTNDKSIDWLAIRGRYIVEELSLRYLADQENVTIDAILKRSAREHWVEARDNYRHKLSAEVINTLAAKEVNARLIATQTAQAVIDSWLRSVKEEASASDAILASKLLLVMAGESTERVDYVAALRKEILGTVDELGQTGQAESGESSFNAVYAAIRSNAGSPSTN